jgi:hypothetical protein
MLPRSTRGRQRQASALAPDRSPRKPIVCMPSGYPHALVLVLRVVRPLKRSQLAHALMPIFQRYTRCNENARGSPTGIARWSDRS